MAAMRGFLAVVGLAAVQDAAAMRLVRNAQIPGRLNMAPFKQIADEIFDAEKAAKDLQYQVSNSSAEKDSVQWFMATAMKELAWLKKVALNGSQAKPPSLAHNYELCYNKTVSQMPEFNKSLSITENLRADSSLAPGAVEAHMYDVYEAEYKVDQLTTELGECVARCPADFGAASASLLARNRGVAAGPAAAPAGAPAGAPLNDRKREQDPKKLMTRIADAIYNTSESIDQMEVHLHKDRSAMDVLEAVTATVVQKLLTAKKDVAKMQVDLQECLHAPQATQLHEGVQQAMKDNPEMSEDMVAAASGRAKEAQSEVTELQAKVDACKAKCS